MSKETNLKFIKDFSKINVASICKELKIDKSNLWTGRTSEENVALVKEAIIKKIEQL